ncbi:hypothetical protein Ppa06_59470 [Planomonospora parontospora subsp. parontospora]|uniref:Uncharacterized protein n=2 Tax=Planomonospora parontospora TaxID=58119 RepID=A0AA37F7C6_9ACTN|nr:hypothetical protein [Planomonospora parontospora]GGK92257.1 hypothetical protein GCM10010126_59480 [Planomonospora parontospora]GII12149.1 hypothetical protein Ppa06_59470 [Planomonospora parontospora subsp. parontospora]
MADLTPAALLPLLVQHIEDPYELVRELLEQAASTAEGDSFVLNGRAYRRVITDSDRHRERSRGYLPVRVIDDATGQIIHIETDEEQAFREWVCIETPRHSGVRIEEMCELTHLSIRRYQRASGEVIALLVIAPSKTDRERVIPMSAELFHVIAQAQAGSGMPPSVCGRRSDEAWASRSAICASAMTARSANVLVSLRDRSAAPRRCRPLFRSSV